MHRSAKNEGGREETVIGNNTTTLGKEQYS